MKTGAIQDGEISIFVEDYDGGEAVFLSYMNHWNRTSKQYKYWGQQE